jgi:hypothetical protein
VKRERVCVGRKIEERERERDKRKEKMIGLEKQ